MKMKILALVAVTSAFAVAACAPTTRFEWGNYEHELYSYTQSPDRLAEYQASLVAAIASGERRNAVAPGLHAELGYLYLQQNDAVQAVEHFKKERDLFPESAQFMNRMIGNLTQGGPK